MRTILFDIRSGQYGEISPDQVKSAAEGRKPLWFFATEAMAIVACADWECSAQWTLGQFNMRGTVKEGSRLVSIIQRDSVRASGHLLRKGDQLRVVEWQEIRHSWPVSKAFLDECVIALGATEEEERARGYHARCH